MLMTFLWEKLRKNMRLVAKRFMIILNEPKNFRRIRKKVTSLFKLCCTEEYLEQLQQYVQETYPKDSEIKKYIEQIQEIEE